MIHHGQRIYSIAQMKGYNKSSLARLMGKTSQAVDYDIKKEMLKYDTLQTYSKILGVDVNEFQKETNTTTSETNWKDLYFQALQKIDKLTTVIIENGIKVDLGKFDVISLPRVTSLYFFAHANTTDNNYGF